MRYIPVVKEVFTEVEHADEHYADKGGNETENEIEDDLYGAVYLVDRNLKGDLVAENKMADDRRGDGGDDHISEISDLHSAHQYLNGEHYSGYGGIKCRRYTRCAPQATRFFMRSSDSLSHWPMVEPSAEPTCTIGPSLPAEPPVPIQIAEAAIFAAATLARIRPLSK